MSHFFKSVQNEADSPLNFSALFLMEVNNLIIQKNYYRNNEDFDGWIRLLMIIFDNVKGLFHKYVNKEEFEKIDKELEMLYLRAKKLDNDLVLHGQIRRLDTKVMEYLHRFNLTMPPKVTVDPFKQIKEMYQLKDAD